MREGGSMNIREQFRSRPQQVLDRLVDGELGVEDRRALLASLDDEPGAWRQCALAFLESQTFGWQLSQVATEPLLVQHASDLDLQKQGLLLLEHTVANHEADPIDLAYLQDRVPHE